MAMSSKISTPVKLEQKGTIHALTGLVKRLRIGPETIVFAYGGSPCQKVSKGILFQRDDMVMVGPHQEPSNLFWVWQGALSTLSRVNGNKCTDIASVSEMVDPAIDMWIRDFEKVGHVKRVPCHNFGGGATRNRMYMVNPDIQIPEWTGHKHLHTHNMWDGARWPVTFLMTEYPTTIRAILPVLATKVISGRASDSERQQLREMRVWDVQTATSLLPSPHHCAQWLGIPENVASDMLGPNTRCMTNIDDLQCEPEEHWQHLPADCRPPKERMSICRVKHWCQECASKISILGNGWHVTAASQISEVVLRRAVESKQGVKHKHLDYGEHAPHVCTHACRYRINLGAVKAISRAERTKNAAGTKGDDIIDV